jgi:hypothetical protein
LFGRKATAAQKSWQLEFLLGHMPAPRAHMPEGVEISDNLTASIVNLGYRSSDYINDQLLKRIFDRLRSSLGALIPRPLGKKH